MSMTPEERAIRNATPGRYLEHFIKEYDITQAELARRTGIPASTINEIIKDKRRINGDVAIAFGAVFGNSPESWLHLHGGYELRIAELDKTAAAIRARVKPLNAA
jgi:addiction module HigA family antidote